MIINQKIGKTNALGIFKFFDTATNGCLKLEISVCQYALP